MQTLSENDELNHEEYEDIQIDSNNCCNPSIRSNKSSHSIQNSRNSQKSLKSTKEKGIKLTHKAKSFNALTCQIKLVTKRSEPIKLNQRMSKNGQSQLSSNVISNLQRCINYKNMKIKEHRQEENDHSQHHLLPPSTEEQLDSTRKNTARTLTSSYDLPLLEKTGQNISNHASIQHSLFRQFKEEKSFHSQRALLINSKQKQQRKTLERVFEQTQGKRIVTLESQFSSEDQYSNEYSIAEAYEFPFQN